MYERTDYSSLLITYIAVLSKFTDEILADEFFKCTYFFGLQAINISNMYSKCMYVCMYVCDLFNDFHHGV